MNAGEVGVGPNRGGDLRGADPFQHDQRITGAAAQALRSCDQQHQVGVVGSSLPVGGPGKIVEAFKILPLVRLLRHCLARGQVGTRSRLLSQEEIEEGRRDHGHMLSAGN